MTVVDRTFVLRGIWVLMRRFSVPIVPPLESASAKLVLSRLHDNTRGDLKQTIARQPVS
jgi:hypothetical protein